MNRLGLSLTAMLALAGCARCGDSGLGPLTETKPTDLGPTGVLIEQPKDGETLTGQWVAVSGWFDVARIDAVLVTGGTTADLYAPGGHVGVPTVPMALTKDGRFLAPRVPLDEGDTTLQVMGFKNGEVTALTKVKVKGSGVATVPITVVADPPVAMGTASVKLAAFTGMGAVGWQWDFEGDGTFDAEEATPTHSYAPGRYQPMARTKADGRWVYGVTALQVSSPGTVGENTAAVAQPRAISVVPDFAGGTRAVLVVDGDAVKVFSPALAPLATLTGLSAPSAAAGDAEGRIYVSDTGHDAVKRFTFAGALDPTFADAGTLGVSKPGALVLDPRTDRLPDGGSSLSWDIRVLDGTGTLVRTSTRDPGIRTVRANPFGERVPKDFVHPLTPEGRPGTMGAWFTSMGVLYRPGISDPTEVLGAAAPRSYAPHTDGTNPYVALIDGDGNLVEVLGAPWNKRVTDLDFDATAVALDPAASAAERAKLDAPGAWTVGPIVLYVGGKGRLERRVMPPMQGVR